MDQKVWDDFSKTYSFKYLKNHNYIAILFHLTKKQQIYRFLNKKDLDQQILLLLQAILYIKNGNISIEISAEEKRQWCAYCSNLVLKEHQNMCMGLHYYCQVCSMMINNRVNGYLCNESLICYGCLYHNYILSEHNDAQYFYSHNTLLIVKSDSILCYGFQYIDKELYTDNIEKTHEMMCHFRDCNSCGGRPKYEFQKRYDKKVSASLTYSELRNYIKKYNITNVQSTSKNGTICKNDMITALENTKVQAYKTTRYYCEPCVTFICAYNILANMPKLLLLNEIFTNSELVDDIKICIIQKMTNVYLFK